MNAYSVNFSIHFDIVSCSRGQEACAKNEPLLNEFISNNLFSIFNTVHSPVYKE